MNDTICAVATASGPGAISVIRVSGPETYAIVNGIFKAKDLVQQKANTLHFGSIRNPKTPNQIIDEVVLSLFKHPHSYTGEDIIEISCHGSPYIRQEIINVLMEQGCRMADPGEFTMRAFLNGKMDLSQAEAVADLIASNSQASHDIAIQQMRGGFSQEIQKLRGELIHFASMLELELDFSEEDVEFADRAELKNLLLKIHKLVDGLMESFRVGNVLKNGVPVVIAGKPNAGKSTLLNLLVKDERAIVSDIAGTTRDAIEEEIVIDGIVFRFVDTAGIRETTDTIEAIGVKKTLEKMQSAAIVVYLFDVNEMDAQAVNEVVKEYTTSLKENKGHLILVGNKTEGQKSNELSTKYASLSPSPLFISAKTNHGVEDMKRSMVNYLIHQRPAGEDTVVSNQRHYHSLSKANDSLLNAFNGLGNATPSDLIAADVRQSLFYLGQITGEVGTEDLLDHIFANFCIGK